MNKTYSDLVARGRERWGERFSEASLDPRFRPYFESGERIKVDFGDGIVKTGTVGVTAGWEPVFLLMLRRDALGSIWTLGRRDKVLAVKRNGRYEETS